MNDKYNPTNIVIKYQTIIFIAGLLGIHVPFSISIILCEPFHIYRDFAFSLENLLSRSAAIRLVDLFPVLSMPLSLIVFILVVCIYAHLIFKYPAISFSAWCVGCIYMLLLSIVAPIVLSRMLLNGGINNEYYFAFIPNTILFFFVISVLCYIRYDKNCNDKEHNKEIK